MKVLIIYNEVWPYREIIFDLINKEFDLTVGFSNSKYIGREYSFKTIYLPVKKIGPFELHTDNINKIANNYDVVIGISNIRWLSLMRLCLSGKRNYKIGYWGIGVTASYKNKFDSVTKWDKVRFFIAKKSNFTIFYSSYPLKRYIEAGISKEKLFVANNTTEVAANNIMFEDKKSFLFVGTLYKQKGIDKLLKAYYELSLKRTDIPDLLIIGDGPERIYIENFIKEKKLINKVRLYGSVYDPNEISKIFSKSMACISPNQAGLSVLTSMGNGTIFVTEKDAITGGEIFNIKNNFNGIVYDETENLTDVLIWIMDHPEDVNIMNKNAYDFYNENRRPEMMANEIKRAIKYSIK